MTSGQIVTAIVVAWPGLGLAGTLIEWIGTTYAKPALVSLGQRLEAISADGPKLLKGNPK